VRLERPRRSVPGDLGPVPPPRGRRRGGRGGPGGPAGQGCGVEWGCSSVATLPCRTTWSGPGALDHQVNEAGRWPDTDGRRPTADPSRAGTRRTCSARGSSLPSRTHSTTSRRRRAIRPKRWTHADR